MAIIATSLLTYYSADELEKLRQMTLLYNLTTRKYVTQFEAGTAADEKVIDITDPTTSDRARDANWATAADGTAPRCRRLTARAARVFQSSSPRRT